MVLKILSRVVARIVFFQVELAVVVAVKLSLLSVTVIVSVYLLSVTVAVLVVAVAVVAVVAIITRKERLKLRMKG